MATCCESEWSRKRIIINSFKLYRAEKKNPSNKCSTTSSPASWKQKAEQVLVCSRFPVCVSCVWTNCDLYFSVSVSLFAVNLEAEALSSLPLVAQCVFGPLQRLSAASVPVFQIKSKINWCSLHRRAGFISSSLVWLLEAACAHDELYLQRLRSQSSEVLTGWFSFLFFSGHTFFFSSFSVLCLQLEKKKRFMHETKNIF